MRVMPRAQIFTWSQLTSPGTKRPGSPGPLHTCSRTSPPVGASLSAPYSGPTTNVTAFPGTFPGMTPLFLLVLPSAWQPDINEFILSILAGRGYQDSSRSWQCDLKGQVCFHRKLASPEANGIECSACLEYPECNRITYHLSQTKVYIQPDWCGRGHPRIYFIENMFIAHTVNTES